MGKQDKDSLGREKKVMFFLQMFQLELCLLEHQKKDM